MIEFPEAPLILRSLCAAKIVAPSCIVCVVCIETQTGQNWYPATGARSGFMKPVKMSENLFFNQHECQK